MSYVTANKSLSSRLTDDTRSINRRRSSILSNDLIPRVTSNGQQQQQQQPLDGTLFDIPPIERQARFEEWIKLTTDNKINTSNSWAVALIDYFHDMAVFRDGDGINFQKASTTLDGCVKVYSSRIDSVITETGKLLSGLATKKEGHEDDDDEGDKDGNSDDDDDDDESGGAASQKDTEGGESGKNKKQKQRSDSTLKKWREIKMRSLDQELSIDPLFKKTLAEFDEGGAKSLLMHMLGVDENVRIMFDTSTGAALVKDEEDLAVKVIKKAKKMKIANLKSSFFGDSGASILDDNVELCPSLGQLEDVVNDIEKAKTVLKDINYDSSYNYSITVNNNNNNNDSIGSLTHATQAILFNNDFDNDNFGADGIEDNDDYDNDHLDNNNDPDNNNNNNEVSQIFSNRNEAQDDTELDNQVLNYFDQQLSSNWTGPVHWKVRALKNNFDNFKDKPLDDVLGSTTASDEPKKTGAARARKEEFRINFFDGFEVSDDTVFANKKGLSFTIQMKEAEDANLLPDDTFFSSKNLIHLFTKEDQTLKLFKTKKSALSDEHVVPQEEFADEKFWADNYEEQGPTGEFGLDLGDALGDADNDGIGGADDVEDDDDDDGDNGEGPDSLEFGTQLLSSQHKNKRTMNFARVAKRVDLIRLKENIWKTIEKDSKNKEVLEFKDVVKSTVKVYPSDQKKDLSTSFEFIALLHLANEKGFVIETNDDYSNLFINLEQDKPQV